jgi:hypothetical protein
MTLTAVNGNGLSSIRSVRDVAEEHIRSTYEANVGKLKQYVIAYHLGISPTTLNRLRKRWASEESVVRDRR